MSHWLAHESFDATKPSGILADMAFRSVIVMGIACLITFCLRRRSASMRHLVWTFAVLALLALPIFTITVPQWHFPVLLPSLDEPAISIHDNASQPVFVTERPARAQAVADLSSNTIIAPHQSEPSATVLSLSSVDFGSANVAGEPNYERWMMLTWGIGVSVLAAPILFAMLSLRRLRLRSRPFEEGFVTSCFRETRKNARLRSDVTLLCSSERQMPMTWGVRRPIILLPKDAETWTAERLRAVLLHEFAHIQRRDCLTQIVAHVMRAIYWFNPLAWLAVARLRIEQERACDDAVLNEGVDAADYAVHLLTVTSGRPAQFFISSVALAISKSSKIERRLVSILDTANIRQPVTRRSVVLAAVVGLTFFLPFASLTIQAGARAKASESATAFIGPAPQAAPEPDAAKKLTDVKEKISKAYVSGVDEKAMIDRAIKGMIDALNDPYAAYFTAAELQKLERDLQGSLTGIGIQIRGVDGKIVVLTPLPNSPGLQAGIQPGDVILEIDGKSSKDMSVQEAVRLIIGRAGTAVNLKVRHSDGKEIDLAITRRQIQLPTVSGFRRGGDDRWEYMLDAADKIGYLRILQFGTGTLVEVQEIIKNLKEAGIKGLIVDLRNCPGGMLQSAYEIAKVFISEGTIVTTRSTNNSEHTYKADGKSLLGDLPLVILVNEQTASAAEILAGAVKDNHRATLLGTRTYGKGSIQEIMKLDADGSAIKLTTAHYFLPSGRTIQKRPGNQDWGVDPTDGYYIPLDAKQAEALQKSMQNREIVGRPKTETKKADALTPESIGKDYADPQLAAALTSMKARLAGGAFTKVGKSQADLLKDIAARESASKRREVLLKSLEEIKKELSDLEQETPAKK